MSKRIWICGNGPSLKHVDLDLLKDEEVWVLNLFNLRQKDDPEHGIVGTSIQPAKWWWMDNPWDYRQWDILANLVKNEKSLHVRHNIVCTAIDELGLLTPDEMHPEMTAVLHDVSKEWENTGIEWTTQNVGFPKWQLLKNDLKWLEPCRGDFPNVYPHLVWRFTNSIAVLLQAAALEDADEVFMVGCDAGIGKLGKGKDFEDSHFHPDYYTPDIGDDKFERWMGDGGAKLVNESIRVCHVFAKIAYDELGIKGYNANPDNMGALEIWPRVDYREVI